MSKDYTRALLQDLKPYIKMNYFCKQIGLRQSTLSLFLRSKDNDYMISEDRLNELVNIIYATVSNDLGHFA